MSAAIDWTEFTRFAIALAGAAAEEILPFFRRNAEVEVKHGPVWDPVTEGDRAGERIMRRMIEDRYPDHGIIGEEYGDKRGTSDFAWILDPVDGTRSFVCGMPTWATLIGLTYRGTTLHEIPPNGQGIAALEMLNIMEPFQLGKMGHNSARALHVMIEAKKLAYADMIRYDADPRFAKIPVAGLNSKDFAKKRAALIDMEKANCSVPNGMPPGTDNGTTRRVNVVA